MPGGATGRPLHAYLREASGGTVARLGRVWTFLVIAQVGIAVAVGAIVLVVGLVAALGPARRGLRIQAIDALKAE